MPDRAPLSSFALTLKGVGSLSVKIFLCFSSFPMLVVSSRLIYAKTVSSVFVCVKFLLIASYCRIDSGNRK